MKIILSNKTDLTPIMVTGEHQYIHGSNRDVLTFVFDNTYSLNELDSIFTEINCETITIIGDDLSESIFNGYVIRTELIKKFEVVEESTSDTEEQTVERIMVSMAQRTYSETKLAQIAQESTDTQLAVAELAELMMA